MNKILFTISAFLILFLTSCEQNVSYEGVESAGKFFPGEENELNGNAFVLADDKYMDIVQESTDAYNNRDWDSMKSLYRDEFVENSAEGMTNYFENEVESLDMNITAMLPVKIKGSDVTRVLTWAVEDRQFKNGQKERHNLFEIYFIDEEDKLGGWNQWYRINPDPEVTSHGLPEGGKIYTDNEYDGRSLVFSNRGEVEIMEAVVEAYNNKDVEGFLEHFADEWRATDHEGNTELRTKADARERMQKWFDETESIEWKPWSIYALKIKDTDPGSGITVRSTEKRVGKDGSVWEKRLVEWFYFDPSGKITRFSQFAQDIKPEEE
ncbi:MAG: nuclear transport factor 2 family protein [Rickettsiales bacterium TMED289]|nr:MAG: nuclear transport factor 2 family protein [Rickettsiales bacterium TMED289]